MDKSEAIILIRKYLEYAKKHGIEVIHICDLEKLLTETEKLNINQASENISYQQEKSAFEQALQNLHESNIAYYKVQSAAGLELFKSVVLTGQAALKSIILINGGAAIALLSFIGHIWNSNPPKYVIYGLTCSLLSFILGVLSSSIASGTTYLSQKCFNINWNRLGNVVNYITVIIVIASYLFFFYGGLLAYNTFTGSFK